MNSFSKSLSSGKFNVEMLNNKEVKKHELTFVIDEEQKRISGQSSCNTYGVSYELEDDELELGFIIATKMYCEDKMEIENEFLKAVGNVKKFKYTEDGEELSFFDNEGDKIIELTKQK